LEPIAEAMQIISSSSVSGNADKYLPTMLHTSLASLRVDMQSTQQKRAAIYLQDMAKQLDSRVLSAVAGQVAADTFSKVKKGG